MRKKPLLLHYYITNRCNAKCSFCQIWSEQPKTDALPEQVFENLYHARKAGCKFVDFTGGEPLLHPELPSFLHEARRLGYVTSITTNGILFPKRAAELKGRVDLLHFSLDADSASLHDSIRGVHSFDKVIESIAAARSLRMTPDLLFTYTNENIEAFEGVYRLARKERLIVILDPVFSMNGMDMVSARTHQRALEYSQRRGVYLNKAHIALRRQGGNRIHSPQCKAVTSTVVLLPDNRIALPCYHHRTDELAIKPDLSILLRSDKRKAALDMEGRYAFCNGCTINCYFDPSFQYRYDSFFMLSMWAKVSYTLTKYILYRRSPFLMWHQLLKCSKFIKKYRDG